MKKNIAYFILTIFLASLQFVSCKEDETVYYSLNTAELTIHPKETFKYQVKVQSLSEDGIYSGGIEWSIVNNEPIEAGKEFVASIDADGIITGVNPGQAEVKAVLDNGSIVMGIVTVNAWTSPGINDIILSASDIYMGKTQVLADTLLVSVTDQVMERFDLEITSSNTEVMTPEWELPSDSLLALGEKDIKVVLRKHTSDFIGDVDILVKAGETVAKCVVHIGTKVYLSFKEIDTSLGTDNILIVPDQSYQMFVNTEDTVKFFYRTEPDMESDLQVLKDNLKIESEGNSVLLIERIEYVENNEVWVFVRTSDYEGTAKLTISAMGAELVAECNVANADNYYPEKLEFKMNKLEPETSFAKDEDGVTLLTKHVIFNLKQFLKVDPLTITQYWPLEWTSSDEEIATVISSGDNEGDVNILKPGNFTITVKCRNMETSIAYRSVLEFTGITIDESVKTSLRIGESAIWKAEVQSNYKGLPIEYTWKSENPEIATVDKDGKVQAVAAGKVMISVSAVDALNNTVETSKELTVRNVDLADVVFAPETFKYFEITSGFSVIDEITDPENPKSFDFKVVTESGDKLDITNPGVYTVGIDFTNESFVEGVFIENGDLVRGNIKEGTIEKLENGNLKFNIKVETLGVEASITGESSPYEE